MPVLVYPAPRTTEEQTESLSNLQLGSPEMLAIRLRVDIELLLGADTLGSRWQPIAQEFIDFTKRQPSNALREIGPYRIRLYRTQRFYVLEDVRKDLRRVLVYSEQRTPEMLLEHGIDSYGKWVWQVVYSIGDKYPPAGATMQRHNASVVVPA